MNTKRSDNNRNNIRALVAILSKKLLKFPFLRVEAM